MSIRQALAATKTYRVRRGFAGRRVSTGLAHDVKFTFVKKTPYINEEIDKLLN